MRFLGKERRNRQIGRRGVSLKKTRKRGREVKIGNLPLRSHSRTNQPPSHRSTPPNQPASISSVRLKHETKTKHSVTQGHKVETPRNGHAKNHYEASEGNS